MLSKLSNRSKIYVIQPAFGRISSGTNILRRLITEERPMALLMPAVPVNEAAAAVVAEQAASPAAIPSAVVVSQPEKSEHAANQDVALAMKAAADEEHPGNGQMAVDGNTEDDNNGNGSNNVDDECKVKVAADLANSENAAVTSAGAAAAAEIPSTKSGADQNVLVTKAVSFRSVAVQTCEPYVGKKTGGSRNRSAHHHYVLRPMPPNFFNLGPHRIEALSSAHRAKVPSDTLLAMLRRRELSPHIGQSLFQPGLIVIRRQSIFTRVTSSGFVRETIGTPTFTTYQCEPSAVNCLGTSAQGPNQGPPHQGSSPIQLVVPIWINNGHEATSGRPREEHITVVVTIAPSKALLRPALGPLEQQQPTYLPTVYHEHRLFITVNERLKAEPGLVVVHESQRVNLDYGLSGVEIPLLTTTFGSPLSAPGHYTACKRDIDYHVPVPAAAGSAAASGGVTWQRKTVRLVLMAGRPDYRDVVTGWSVIGSSTPNLAVK